MDASALRRTEDNLSSALQAIAGLAAVLQADPLIRGTAGVPARLRAILDRALDERTIPEVISEGEKLERAFLVVRRGDLSKDLRLDIDKQRRESFAKEAPAPQPSSSRIKNLRADIERIDRRLAMLGAAAPTTPPPGAN
jgi:hypothetical protein